MTEEEPTNEEIEEFLENHQVGSTDGTVICDGCGKRIKAGTNPTMTGYATSPQRRKKPIWLLKVYCEEDNNREVSPPTRGVVEVMVEFEVIRVTPAPQIRNVEVIDRAGYNEGDRY